MINIQTLIYLLCKIKANKVCGFCNDFYSPLYSQNLFNSSFFVQRKQAQKRLVIKIIFVFLDFFSRFTKETKSGAWLAFIRKKKILRKIRNNLVLGNFKKHLINKNIQYIFFLITFEYKKVLAQSIFFVTF